MKTNDAGATWIPTTVNFLLNFVYFPDALTGYSAGYAAGNGKGAILKTTDAGASWNVSLSGASQAFNSIYFKDVDIGYAVGDEGIIMKTVNGGSTWMNLSSGTMDDFYSVFFLNADKGYVVAWEGDILKTLDGGLNWINDSSGTRNSLYSVFFTDSTTGYVVGDGGTILKTGNGGYDFTEEQKQIRPKFIIMPNPATDIITISSEIISKNEEINITILSMRGEYLLTGQFFTNNKIELNVSNLIKGIYLIKIQAKEGIEVKKLVVD